MDLNFCPKMVWNLFLKRWSVTGLIFLLSGICQLASGQRVANLRTELKSGLMTVTYDLVAPSEEYSFDVKLYSSHNNYSVPVTRVTGDVGEGVKSGINKKLIWNVREELGVFQGSLQVELSATPKMVVPAIELISPAGGQVVRRGKNLEVKWKGGSKTEEVEIQLTRGTDLHRKIEKVSNTGSYSLSIAKDEPLGEYQVRVLSLSGEVFSKPFEVKKPSKLLLKILPVVGLAGVAAVLTGGGSSGGVKELPVAPVPE